MGKVPKKNRTLINKGPKNKTGYTELPGTVLKPNIFHEPLIHVLLIIVLGLIVYSNSFQAPFIFDDIPNILNNPTIRDMKYFFDPSSAKETSFYGPLKIRFIGYLSFALNYELNGLDVAGYHMVNLAIHIINALLVYWVVILTFKTPLIKSLCCQYHRFGDLIPLFSALLFVSHPIETQAVTYVVQRLASLATMFYLLSVSTYIKSRISSGRFTSHAFYIISIISAILAMKTKEIAFTLPVMIVLYEIIFLDWQLKKRVLYLLPLLLTMTIIPITYLSLHAHIGTLITDVGEATKVQTSMPRLDYLLTEFSVIVTYIRLLILPIGQNLDYDYPVYHSFLTPRVFLPFLLLVVIIGFGIIMLYRHKKDSPYLRIISYGIFWFFITLSIESSIIPIEDVIFEHRIYLPSVGAFMAIMTSIFAAAEYYRIQVGKYLVPVCVLIIVAFSGVAYLRNAVWRDQITLWRHVVEKSPGKARGHHNLGLVYQHQGLNDKAKEQYLTALRLKPDYADAHTNLGLIYQHENLIDKAMEQYLIALSLKPDSFEAHSNLSLLYLAKGLSDKAIEQSLLALKLNPYFVEAHYNLASAYRVKGLSDEAIEQYRMVLSLKPDHAEAHSDLGYIYQEKGLTDKALEQYLIAMSLKPDHIQAHNNLGLIYQHKGQFDKAIEQYQMALNLNPNLSAAHFNLGSIYLDNGAFEMARREFREVLRISPADYKAKQILIGIANLSDKRADKD